MGTEISAHFHVYLARPKRFELLTPWFVAKYSIQLSYGRVFAKSRIISGFLSFVNGVIALFFLSLILA